MAVLTSQELLVDEKTFDVKLTNKINLDPLLRENYRERMAVGKAKGSNSFRPIASIPLLLLEADEDGRMYLEAKPESPEARIALRRFMGKTNPISGIPNSQYKTSTSNI